MSNYQCKPAEMKQILVSVFSQESLEHAEAAAEVPCKMQYFFILQRFIYFTFDTASSFNKLITFPKIKWHTENLDLK